jgi:hypothetical protein
MILKEQQDIRTFVIEPSDDSDNQIISTFKQMNYKDTANNLSLTKIPSPACVVHDRQATFAALREKMKSPTIP